MKLFFKKTYLTTKQTSLTDLITTIVNNPAQTQFVLSPNLIKFHKAFTDTCPTLSSPQLQPDRRTRPVLHQPGHRTDYHQLPAGSRGQGQLPAAGRGNRWRAASGLVELRHGVRDGG